MNVVCGLELMRVAAAQNSTPAPLSLLSAWLRTRHAAISQQRCTPLSTFAQRAPSEEDKGAGTWAVQSSESCSTFQIDPGTAAWAVCGPDVCSRQLHFCSEG